MEHFNLIMLGDCEGWDKSPTTFMKVRLFEYTDKPIVAKFKNDLLDLQALIALPTIFCYEKGCQREARLGRVTNIQEKADLLNIHFEFRDDFKPIPENEFLSLHWELQLEKYEENRTHWAVKTGDIEKILEDAGFRATPTEEQIAEAEALLAGERALPPEQPAAGFPVFISYAHADKEFLDRLNVHLKSLRGIADVDAWSDERLGPGDHWREGIAEAIEKCRVAIILVSADFLASDFITSDELPPLLQAAKERGVRIVPIIAGPCLYTRHPSLAIFQAINDPRRTLLDMEKSEREGVYRKVAETIASMADVH